MVAPRRRLLFYTHALVGGGAEKVWAQTAAGLAARGHRVDFCVDWDADANAHLIPHGMTIHRLGRNHLAGIWNLRRLLAAGRYFAAFSAVGASNLKLLAASALAGSSCKIVLSQHGHYEAESRFLGRLGYRLTAVTSRLAAKTVVVSDELRRDLATRFGANLGKVSRIYNAIDLAPASDVPDLPALRGRPDDILAVGRLVREKGHEILVRAMTLLPPEARLTICGEGPHEPHLKQLIASLGLGDRVRLAGYHRDLTQFYKTAKVLALPSETEAFGNVVVEAMGFGLPVVATRCGGPVEILGQGRYGKIVPVGDASAMASALQEVMTNPGDPADRRRRAETFSADRILEEYEALIASLEEARA
jgi:glycosyltransferase involved in cell wall biosynthesis